MAVGYTVYKYKQYICIITMYAYVYITGLCSTIQRLTYLSLFFKSHNQKHYATILVYYMRNQKLTSVITL